MWYNKISGGRDALLLFRGMIRNEPIIGAEEFKAVQDVLLSRELSMYRANKDWHLGGKYVQSLESAFCDFFNVEYAVAMNSATSCLHAACIASGGKTGITSTLTFSASASCILQAGMHLQLSDIDPDTYCMVLPECSSDVIIPVHLHGHPADMDSILKHNKFVIEDASQAIMAKYKGEWVGTIGDCGVFSFNQWKQMSCGEGGMLITNNEEIARICRLVRNHGETQQDTILGYNYRLTEIQSAIALEQFKKLSAQINYRIELADYLTDKLKEVKPPYVQEGCIHSYYTYPVRTENRAVLQSALLEAGYYFGQGGQKPLHKYPFYSVKGKFPVAEDCERNVMFTDIIRTPATFDDMDNIAEVIDICFGRDTHLKRKQSRRMDMSRK